MERLKNAIRQIKLRDFLAPFIFVLMLLPSWIFRLINKVRGRKMWLVTEQGDARDNGYHFYKYVREKHPDDYCFYAINPESPGYKKIEKLGNIVKYGSLRHWLYYMSANLNISSQKASNPCSIFWYIMHVRLGLYKNRVFLQHGITQNDVKFVYYKQSKFKYFLCGAKPEYEFVKEKFGYPKNAVILTGFPRWDNLKDTSKKTQMRSILVMPTWRNWLGGERNSLFEINDFEKTKYYKCWSRLLNDDKFIDHIEKNNIKVYFYPHVNMMKYIDLFSSKSDNVTIISSDSDIQKCFMECNLMITDYSSVAFDFVYLNKPIIYYQFDRDEYRKKQYQEGYFSYDKDGFGEVFEKRDSVVDKIKFYTCNNYEMDSKYQKRANDFFMFRDANNSERVYKAIK